MTLDEWRTVQETEPATPRQRGAVMGQFTQLGYHRRYDRAARLAVAARILGLDGLATTSDLTTGQAGMLLGTLSGFASRAALDAEFPSPATRKARRRARQPFPGADPLPFKKALAECIAACGTLPWDRVA
jgi:hypothetical protein